MRVLIVTGLTHLNPGGFRTSSERFEFELCNALRDYAGLEVVLISKPTDWQLRYQHESRIVGMRDRNSLLGLRDVFGALQASPEDVVIFWGYDSRLVIHLLQCRRRYGFRLVNFLYDHFGPAVEQMRAPKAIVARAYFAIAERAIPHIDGLIVFNAAAIKRVGFTGPHLTLHPCFPEDRTEIVDLPRSQMDRFTLTYAGTLAEYNSVRQLLEAFRGLPGDALELRIFGSGPLESLVREHCMADHRIHFGGLLPREAVLSEQRSANLLLNIRRTDGIINDFAFPSKLLDYIATGVPTLSTDFGDVMNPLRNCLFVIRDNSVEAIRAGILEVLNTNPAVIEQQQRSMKDLMCDERFHWPYNAQSTASFLRTLVP